MAISPAQSGSLARAALACATVLVVSLLNAPAATADVQGGFRLAPAADQPTELSTTSTEGAAPQRATVADTSSSVSAASTAVGCPGVQVANGAGPAGGYLPLSAFGTLPLDGVGDETNTAFSVPAYTYNGRTYTALQVDSNGYLQVGSPGTVSIANQDFPDAAVPNNVLAPFWTDLNPGAGGAVRITTLTDGSDTWIVVDWDAVPEFSSAARTHSFEVWIGIQGDADPGQDISYAYGSNTGNGDGGFLTVGAENADGTSGGVTYVDGVGTLPSNGTQIRVSSDLFASFTADPTSGASPLEVSFDASSSFDDGSITDYSWAFGDSATGSGATTSHTYAPGTYTATLTVTDDENQTCTASQQITSTRALISIDDVEVVEGDSGTQAAVFTVQLNVPSARTVRVTARTANGSARAPRDYLRTNVVVTFQPGQTSATVEVGVVGDGRREPDETYSVRLVDPVNAALSDATGTGIIVNDD
jgi:PKD repeat protein